MGIDCTRRGVGRRGRADGRARGPSRGEGHCRGVGAGLSRVRAGPSRPLTPTRLLPPLLRLRPPANPNLLQTAASRTSHTSTPLRLALTAHAFPCLPPSLPPSLLPVSPQPPAAILVIVAWEYLVPNHLVWAVLAPLALLTWMSGRLPTPATPEFWMLAYFGFYRKVCAGGGGRVGVG